MGRVEDLRRQVDRLDEEIVRLLKERLSLSQALGKVKRDRGSPIQDSSREDEVLAHISDLARKLDLRPEELEAVYRHIISMSRLVQGEVRKVAFLGPRGTFSEVASRKIYQAANVEYVEKAHIEEIFRSVSAKEVDHGVVPIENSTEGSVNLAVDLLLESDVKVVGEIEQRIRHNLIANPRSKGKDFTAILSHPQALAQCRKFLSHNYPNATPKEVSSTAAAVRMLGRNRNAAAIGTELAAQMYGMKVIARGIEDNPQNYTRFFVLGTEDLPASGKDKTSVIFFLKHQPGALHGALQLLAERSINLTKIESRPIRQRPWEYFFFCDFEGHRDEPNCREALDAMRQRCEYIKVLGSYPRAL